MKHFAALPALAFALIAVPASAELGHQTTVSHQGGVLAVSYEPRVQTRLKQTGIGPRSSAGCLWSTRVSVERSVTDASGRPIAALSRIIEGETAHSGMHLGYCRDVAAHRADAFSGGREALRGFVGKAAARDEPGLRVEMASLDLLRVADTR